MDYCKKDFLYWLKKSFYIRYRSIDVSMQFIL